MTTRTELSQFNTEYLDFVWAAFSDSGKTQIWHVRGRSDLLGQISWFGRWRQYVFEPGDETVYNDACLTAITTALLHANNDHKRQGKHQ